MPRSTTPPTHLLALPRPTFHSPLAASRPRPMDLLIGNLEAAGLRRYVCHFSWPTSPQAEAGAELAFAWRLHGVCMSRSSRNSGAINDIGIVWEYSNGQTRHGSALGACEERAALR